jgi:rRNA small subunit pseudouridine methyltransferase Nep1
LSKYLNTIVLEDASLELVPKKYRNHDSCQEVERKFGVPADLQILDDNFHHAIVSRLKQGERRGRPDIVHIALLDITSTPLYMNDGVRVVIHTCGQAAIILGRGVRIPRTLQRFCGVMSRILARKQEEREKGLFSFNENQSLEEVISLSDATNVVSFSRKGVLTNLNELVKEIQSTSTITAWIVGAFPHGHFKDEVRAVSNRMVSISDSPLPAHVVTARLSYELERTQGIT